MIFVKSFVKNFAHLQLAAKVDSLVVMLGGTGRADVAI